MKWKFTKVLENPSLHSPFLNYDAAKIIEQVPLRWSKNQNFACKREIKGAWKVGKKKKMKKEARYSGVVTPPFFHKECRVSTMLGLFPSIKAQSSSIIKILLK